MLFYSLFFIIITPIHLFFTTGSSKRLKIEKHAKILPMRKDEPGFSWYGKSCCESKCTDCEIDSRFSSSSSATESVNGLVRTLVAGLNSPCGCEFKCVVTLEAKEREV